MIEVCGRDMLDYLSEPSDENWSFFISTSWSNSEKFEDEASQTWMVPSSVGFETTFESNASRIVS